MVKTNGENDKPSNGPGVAKAIDKPEKKNPEKTAPPRSVFLSDTGRWSVGAAEHAPGAEHRTASGSGSEYGNGEHVQADPGHEHHNENLGD